MFRINHWIIHFIFTLLIDWLLLLTLIFWRITLITNNLMLRVLWSTRWLWGFPFKISLDINWNSNRNSKIPKGQTEIVKSEDRQAHGQQNETKDKHRTHKATPKTKAGWRYEPYQNVVEFRCSGRVSSSCSNSGNRRVTR